MCVCKYIEGSSEMSTRIGQFNQISRLVVAKMHKLISQVYRTLNRGCVHFASIVYKFAIWPIDRLLSLTLFRLADIHTNEQQPTR